MRICRPAAVLFDIGGTLLVEHGYDLKPGIEELLRLGCLEPSQADVLARKLGAAIDEVHLTNRAEFRFTDWLAENLRPEAATDLPALEARVWRHVVKLSPTPGADRALAALGSVGISMAAVSNAIFAANTLAGELDRHGLLEPLEFVVSSADEGVRKPDLRIFRSALDRLGAAPPETWFVGDSWSADVVGASRAGLTPIWMRSPGAVPAGDIAHLEVSGFDALIELAHTVLT